MAATFSSALAYALSCVGKPVERQAAGGVDVSVRWCLCGYRTDRLWQVHLLSRLSLSWLMWGPVHLSLKEVLWWWFLLFFLWVKPSSKCWCVCSTFSAILSRRKHCCDICRNWLVTEQVRGIWSKKCVAWMCLQSEGLVTWVHVYPYPIRGTCCLSVY